MLLVLVWVMFVALVLNVVLVFELAQHCLSFEGEFDLDTWLCTQLWCCVIIREIKTQRLGTNNACKCQMHLSQIVVVRTPTHNHQLLYSCPPKMTGGEIIEATLQLGCISPSIAWANVQWRKINSYYVRQTCTPNHILNQHLVLCFVLRLWNKFRSAS